MLSISGGRFYSQGMVADSCFGQQCGLGVGLLPLLGDIRQRSSRYGVVDRGYNASVPGVDVTRLVVPCSLLVLASMSCDGVVNTAPRIFGDTSGNDGFL